MSTEPDYNNPFWVSITSAGTSLTQTYPVQTYPINSNQIYPTAITGVTSPAAWGSIPKLAENEILHASLMKQIADAENSPHAALIGYRMWRLVHMERGPRLQSYNHPQIWEPRKEFVADKAPEKGNANGVYAARNLEHLGNMGYAFSHGDMIVGEVSLWGHIRHGYAGYRAEKAYPKAFYFPEKIWWVDHVCELYGVKSVILNEN